MWPCRCRVPWVRSRGLLVGLRLRGAARRLRESPDDGPAREIDLERVVPEAFGLTQDEIGRQGERRLAGGAAAQRRFGLGISPGFVRDSAEGKPRFPDGAA